MLENKNGNGLYMMSNFLTDLISFLCTNLSDAFWEDFDNLIALCYKLHCGIKIF